MQELKAEVIREKIEEAETPQLILPSDIQH
jgi:hypothetical protein